MSKTFAKNDADAVEGLKSVEQDTLLGGKHSKTNTHLLALIETQTLPSFGVEHLPLEYLDTLLQAPDLSNLIFR